MGVSGTGNGVVNVTPSDDATNGNITRKNRSYPRALRFGTGGTATVIAPDDTSAVFTNIANGETIHCDVKRVAVSGSSGIANIVGFY